MAQALEEVQTVTRRIEELANRTSERGRNTARAPGVHKANDLPRGLFGGAIPVIVGAAQQRQEGILDWVWARWPRGFPGGGETPDCALMAPWAHWWWNPGGHTGQTRVLDVPEEEMAERQEELYRSYEAERETEPRDAPWGTGRLLDGMVVAGWSCWHDQRPVLAGMEPVSQEMAEWVYQLEGGSMVGPGRTKSGRRKTEDGHLQTVFLANVSPRGDWEKMMEKRNGLGAERERVSRQGSSPASSRRGRGEGERR